MEGAKPSCKSSLTAWAWCLLTLGGRGLAARTHLKLLPRLPRRTGDSQARQSRADEGLRLPCMSMEYEVYIFKQDNKFQGQCMQTRAQLCCQPKGGMPGIQASRRGLAAAWDASLPLQLDDHSSEWWPSSTTAFVFRFQLK